MERNKLHSTRGHDDPITKIFGDNPKREAFQREVRDRVAEIGLGLGASMKDAMEVCDDLYKLANADATRVTDDEIREAYMRIGITKLPTRYSR